MTRRAPLSSLVLLLCFVLSKAFRIVSWPSSPSARAPVAGRLRFPMHSLQSPLETMGSRLRQRLSSLEAVSTETSGRQATATDSKATGKKAPLVKRATKELYAFAQKGAVQKILKGRDLECVLDTKEETEVIIAITMDRSTTRDMHEYVLRDAQKKLPGGEEMSLGEIEEKVGKDEVKRTVVELLVYAVSKRVADKVRDSGRVEVGMMPPKFTQSIDGLKNEFEPGKPFSWKISLDKPPRLSEWTREEKWKGLDFDLIRPNFDYRYLHTLEILQEKCATLKSEKKGAPAQYGDGLLVESMDCYIMKRDGSRGEKIIGENFSLRNESLTLNVLKSSMDLVEALIGIEDGENRTFTIEVPSSMEVIDLEGLTAQQADKLVTENRYTEIWVEVKGVSVHEREFPALTDSWAWKNANCSLSDMLNKVQERVFKAMEQYEDQSLQTAVFQAFERIAKVSIPRLYVSNELTKRHSRLVKQLQAQPEEDRDLETIEYLTSLDGKQEWIDNEQPDVVSSLHCGAVARAIAEEEGIDMEKCEFQVFDGEGIDRTHAEGSGMFQQNVEAQFKGLYIMKRVLDEVAAAASVKYRPETPDDIWPKEELLLRRRYGKWSLDSENPLDLVRAAKENVQGSAKSSGKSSAKMTLTPSSMVPETPRQEKEGESGESPEEMEQLSTSEQRREKALRLAREGVGASVVDEEGPNEDFLEALLGGPTGARGGGGLPVSRG
uniref:Trigger factor C-terminal domain-containing protein n=1 Tax=Chromera velia CCMP2878 TaxID=1169474 RepID=A0A0G4HKJ5_9ALVE|eukprot:Cvel_7225.t1-p1 / transcript=Cvel_7225.t1 / gene=Cvel_7225 / organism=Chromera_velia_CCMP2878 / gene_product=Trigger factor, putative / transcript_product=Trigger factor, putative / location=Cvel_scaffold372:83635-87281(-) / protein_length=720 / sequence_SO=supercontig / SO=protein_coding / is_pseudo=false